VLCSSLYRAGEYIYNWLKNILVVFMVMSDREYLEFVDSVSRDYKGDGRVLASALGALSLGRMYGWRVLAIVESEPTIRKYQVVLGVKFKDVLPERGLYAYKSFGLKVADKFDSFWSIVQGRGAGKIPRSDKILIE